MAVETTGGVSIELSGNLVENGIGYLKGKVKSGIRSGITNFAGLILGTAFTGSINRITGSSYNKGNGEGVNFKRYYELNNTGGGGISSDISIACRTSGTYDERNTLNDGPYFVYKHQSNWKGYGDGSTGSTVSANSVIVPSGSGTDLVISKGTGVAAKIYLEGPYNSTANNMNVVLNADVPIISPYSEDPRTAASKPANAVDWVLVQLRETTSGATVESRAAFINIDGFLIEDDGTQGVGIKAKPGDYFIVIKHRNHLRVMTSTIQNNLTWGG